MQLNYISPITEIDAIIIDHLDPVSDIVRLGMTSRYYHEVLSCHPIFIEIRELNSMPVDFQWDHVPYVPKDHKKIYEMFWHGCKCDCLLYAKYISDKYNLNIELGNCFVLTMTCGYGSLRIIDWLLQLDLKYYRYTSIFTISCANNRLEIAQLIYNKYHDLITLSPALVKVCENRHINVFKWLVTLDNVFEFINMPNLFVTCCVNFEMAKIIYDHYDITNIMDSEEHIIMRKCCVNGNLDMLIWLCNLNDNFDIHFNDDLLFHESCRYGHIDTAKWLYSIDPAFINMRFGDDITFRTCLKYSKWYTEGTNITLFVGSYDAKNFSSIVGWLCEICDDYKDKRNIL